MGWQNNRVIGILQKKGGETNLSSLLERLGESSQACKHIPSMLPQMLRDKQILLLLSTLYCLYLYYTACKQ